MKLEGIKKLITNCSTREETNKLKEDSKKFIRNHEFLDLRKQIVPLAKKVEKELMVFSLEHKDLKDSVINFDRVLCQKANKTKIELLEDFIDKNLLKKDEINTVLDQI